ncbi:MAG: helix-turn-helix domain-containing protein [Planctomycetota bacterium]
MPRFVIKKSRPTVETAAPAAARQTAGPSPLLTREEAWQYLKVSERTLRALSHPHGPLVKVKPTPGRVCYRRADLDAFLAERVAAEADRPNAPR